MKVLILMGSDSDLPVMEETARILDEFGIPYDMTVASAHRTPERVTKLVKTAERKGARIIVAAAGMAAHLAGAVAAQTTLPVIGVPVNASPMGGLDALLSTVQMPPGIPVATVAVGKAGAKNAAYLAAEILATADAALSRKLRTNRKKQARDIEKKAKGLNRT